MSTEKRGSRGVEKCRQVLLPNVAGKKPKIDIFDLNLTEPTQWSIGDFQLLSQLHD